MSRNVKQTHVFSLILFVGRLSASLSVRKIWGSIPGPFKSDAVSLTARQRCDASSERCFLGAKLRKLAAPLDAHFGVISPVQRRFDYLTKHHQIDAANVVETHNFDFF